MNTPFFIAKRYLFSKKSVNAINIISGISTLGVFIGSAALIIILSVFNGFEQLILNMFSALSSDLRIEPASGKFFQANSEIKAQLNKDSRVLHYSEVLQERVLLRYGSNQFIAVLKGMDGDFSRVNELIEVGNGVSEGQHESQAILGAAVQAYLGVDIEEGPSFISVYSPRKDVVSSINPADEFNIQRVRAVGVLYAQPSFDEYFITPLSFAQELLNEYSQVSAIELDLKNGVRLSAFQRELSSSLGSDFTVKNVAQQNPSLYKILNSEKWAVFFILTFVVIIAILNIIGSLTMLVIDKRKDIVVLRSLGANSSFIQRIFFTEGMLISLMGCIGGMLFGFLFCLAQLKFGMIKMSGSGLISDTYPIALKGTDFLLVFGTVFVISGIASYISSKLSLKSNEQLS